MKEDIFYKCITNLKREINSRNYSRISDELDETVNFIVTNFENNEAEKLKILSDSIINDTIIYDKIFINSIYRKLINLISHYLSNDKYSALAIIISSLGYFRENIIPFWFIKEMTACYMKERPHIRCIFPLFENYDLAELIINISRELAEDFKRYRNYSYLHDQLLRNKTAVFLSSLSESGKTIVMSETISAFEAVTIIYIISFMNPDNFVNIKFILPLSDEKIRKAVSSYPFNNLIIKLYKSFISQNNLPDKKYIFPDIKSNFTTGYTMEKHAVVIEKSSNSNALSKYYLITSSEKKEGKLVEKTESELRSNGYRDKIITYSLYECTRESKQLSVSEFYKTLRKAGSQEEVKKKLKLYKLPSDISPEEKVMLADIYYRAGHFTKAFDLIKKNHNSKPGAAYRILKGIVKLSNNNKLINKCEKFIEEKELNIKGFSMELVEAINDEIERDMKKNIRKSKDAWL